VPEPISHARSGQEPACASNTAANAPRPTLSASDAVAIIVGMVVGSGIFTVPPLVASSLRDPGLVLGVWFAGGVLAMVGALCYAELATAYPDAGGDYFFLRRAYGPKLAFVYAWARVAVITTGSTAFLAFTFGDYMTKVASLGSASSSLYAALSILGLTSIQLAGLSESKRAQKLLTLLEVLGLVLLIGVGLWGVPAAPSAPVPAASGEDSGAPLGLALVLVLYAYGGWNEAAYLSAEMQRTRSLARALIASLLLVTGLFVLANFAYMRGLSLATLARSKSVAADLLELRFGDRGALAISLIIALAALTSIHATLLLAARSNFALGRDSLVFTWLGRWHHGTNSPRRGLLAQCAVSLFLVALGSHSRTGLSTMIEFTAPVFWAFLLLVGLSVFVLRAREPARPRPFRVPLYPITPVVFCATCASLLFASLEHARSGAIASLGVVVLGFSALSLEHRRKGLAGLCAALAAAILVWAFSRQR